MTDFATSLIRTIVPTVVGSLIGWLITLGITLPDHAADSLTAGIVALSIALYYGAARWLEIRWPAFGYLLGTRAEPTYPASAVVGYVEVPSGFAALPRRDLSPEDVAQLASLAAALDEGDPARTAIEALGIEAVPYVPRHAASSVDD